MINLTPDHLHQSHVFCITLRQESPTLTTHPRLVSETKKHDSIEPELLFTKAVKLTSEDLEFIKDMAIAVKSEGNVSEGIRACIKAARKQYGDDVKELAARRKSFEAVKI